MKVTLLGTGSPVPLINRTGTSILLESAEDRLLIDCGPGTVRRLLEQGINPGSIDTLLFSHHHIDHNADFYNFVITNWTRGNGTLDIYGPDPWTTSLVESIYDIYQEDLHYRDNVNSPGDLIWNLDPTAVSDGTEIETDSFTIRSLAVSHSIETYGFYIEEKSTGRSLVFSGDTQKIDALGPFARHADVLIMDCCLGPTSDSLPDDEYIWEQYTTALPTEMREKLHETHCDPLEAGEIAAEADVDTLVLTHLLPYRDATGLCELAGQAFDGDIHAADDGMAVQIGDSVQVLPAN